jgi:hypothetical protein
VMKSLIFIITWVAGLALVKLSGLDTLEFHWLMFIGCGLGMFCFRVSGMDKE